MDSFDTFDDFDLDDLTELGETDVTSVSTARLPRHIIVLWLLAGGLLFTLLPISLISRAIEQDTERTEIDIQEVEEALLVPPTPPPEIQPLLGTLEAVQAELASIDAAPNGAGEGHIYWPHVIAAIRTSPTSPQIALSRLSQQGLQIILEGTAASDKAVVDYAQRLEVSGLFSRVLIQSIVLLEPPQSEGQPPDLSTPAPTPTVAETSPGGGGMGDPYEIDDFNPVDIVLGEPQLRSFYPVHDVDKVKFLAKAGRHYRVYTAALAPGVDTFVTVRVGGLTYVNDDAKPGTLASEVVILGGAADAIAVVQISNRGQYGPEMTYEIAVEEVLPTPSPPPTDTPQPTNTLLPSATPTAVPTHTPQPTLPATPDNRDAYEPDDMSPRPLTPGETQLRNFYPAGDMDRVYFLVKTGRRYQMETTSLAAGVDTVLTVEVAGTTHTNDDRAWGDLSSLVVVEGLPDRDVTAYATVTNRGVFGPTQTYLLSLKEIAPEPTLTPTATAPPATATPTPTPTASEDSHDPRRPPGVARLRPSASDQQVESPHTVAFTIILELRQGAP